MTKGVAEGIQILMCTVKSALGALVQGEGAEAKEQVPAMDEGDRGCSHDGGEKGFPSGTVLSTQNGMCAIWSWVM